MKLAYQAYDNSGRTVRGTLDAADVDEATERLYADGLYVTSISETEAERDKRGMLKIGTGGAAARIRNLALFTRQMSVLTSTGTPIVQALGAVERQIRSPSFRAVVADIRRRVEEGDSLHAAMREHPRYFDAIYRSLIEAGESSGRLSPMLTRLSSMTRQQLRTRNSLLGSMMYPVLLLGVSFVVVIAMLTLVLPRFTGLFETLDSPIPPSTQALLAVSDAIRAYWWGMVIVLGGAAGWAAWWLRTENGRLWIDAALLRIPFVESYVRGIITARIVRVLGVLLDSKVPMLESLRLTREAAGNAKYAELLARTEESVTRGEPISTVFRHSPLINPAVYEAIQTGESTGQIGPVLTSLADAMDEDNEIITRSLASILEPVILIVLGLIVGFVAVSMFLPLFDLTAAAQG